LEKLLIATLARIAVFTLCPQPSIAQKSQKAIDYYNSGLRKQESGDLEGALADSARERFKIDPGLRESFKNFIDKRL